MSPLGALLGSSATHLCALEAHRTLRKTQKRPQNVRLHGYGTLLGPLGHSQGGATVDPKMGGVGPPKCPGPLPIYMYTSKHLLVNTNKATGTSKHLLVNTNKATAHV